MGEAGEVSVLGEQPVDTALPADCGDLSVEREIPRTVGCVRESRLGWKSPALLPTACCLWSSFVARPTRGVEYSDDLFVG